MLSPAYGYAIMTGAAGALLLLWWAYATTAIPRSNVLLTKSLWLFVVPGAVLWALPEGSFNFPLSMWVGILIEEALKTVARSTERGRLNRFWLIMLFGIWELMLAKPLWGLANEETLDKLSQNGIAGLVMLGLVAVLMHTVTAAIYAFHFQRNLWAAFLASWLVHLIYNELVYLFPLSPVTSVLQAVVLLILLRVLWPEMVRVPREPKSAL